MFDISCRHPWFIIETSSQVASTLVGEKFDTGVKKYEDSNHSSQIKILYHLVFPVDP